MSERERERKQGRKQGEQPALRSSFAHFIIPSIIFHISHARYLSINLSEASDRLYYSLTAEAALYRAQRRWLWKKETATTWKMGDKGEATKTVYGKRERKKGDWEEMRSESFARISTSPSIYDISKHFFPSRFFFEIWLRCVASKFFEGKKKTRISPPRREVRKNFSALVHSIRIFAKIEHTPSYATIQRPATWDEIQNVSRSHTRLCLVVAPRANIWKRKLKLTIHINLWSPPPLVRSSVSLSLKLTSPARNALIIGPSPGSN